MPSKSSKAKAKRPGAGNDKPAKRRAASKKKKKVGVLGHGDLATSLVLIFPLFLAYEIGVMFSSTVNGVDFTSRWVFAAVGEDRERYLIAHLVMAAGYLAYLLYLRSKRRISMHTALPMLLESCIYALTLGTFIIFIMQNLLGFGDTLVIAGHALDELALGPRGEAVVISLGAGVHEELVFRLAMMGGTAYVLMRFGARQGLAVLGALLASALIFSAAHHVGPQGDEFQMGVFTYRALAGVCFGLIFYYRSLAHAVYSHFLYDLYVLLVRT